VTACDFPGNPENDPVMRIVAATSPAAATSADIVLLPGRAALVPATGTLLVADLHLGKAATFRRAGIPVPEGSARRDLDRLAELVTATAARWLVILGDLFHGRSGCTERVFAEFAETRSRFAATEVVLVAGNHDRQIGSLPPTLGIDALVRSVDEPPFHLVHDPSSGLAEPGRKAFTVGGHLHPVIMVRTPSGERMTDRCFVADADVLVMPAFGSFTGGERVTPREGLRLWIARDDGVVDVTRAALLATRGRR